MAKTGFKENIKIDSAFKSVKNPWNFDAPPYDQRTSCYTAAGVHHGVGKKQPIGMEGNPKSHDGVPRGRVNTLQVSYTAKKIDKIDLE